MILCANTNRQVRRLRSEVEAGWQAAKEWFHGEVLVYNGYICYIRMKL